MSKVRLVVVGNGMVGHRFIEELIERADPGRYEITVFGAEPRPAYDRVHLSSYFSHHTSEISPSSNPASTTSMASACCSAKR